MSSSTAKPPSRIGWAILVVLFFLLLGLVAGTAIGSRFVPAGSGLAGPAIALGYGVIGALVAGLLAGVLVWKAPFRILKATALVCGACIVAFAAFTAWRLGDANAARDAELGLDVPLPSVDGFQVHAVLSERDQTRSYREFDLDSDDWSFRYIAVGPEAAPCSGALKAAEAESLMQALAALRQRLQAGAELCPEIDEEPVFSISYTGSGGDWAADGGMSCMQRERELMALDVVLRRIPRTALDEQRLTCDLGR